MAEAVPPNVVTAPSATTTPTDTSAQQHVPATGRGYDLKSVLRDSGRRDARPPPTGHRQVVRMRGSAPVDTSTAVPVDVAGFADGIQSDLVVCYVEHRPVTLVWVAAGAVGAGGELLATTQWRTPRAPFGARPPIDTDYSDPLRTSVHPSRGMAGGPGRVFGAPRVRSARDGRLRTSDLLGDPPQAPAGA